MSAAARLSTLLTRAGITPVGGPGPDPEIGGASLDSRRIRPGDLFFALRGRTVDGEAFVDEAVRRGASAIVASSPRPDDLAREVAWVQVAEPRRSAALLSRECHERPDERLLLAGITGTNGKTTVAYLVESIADAAGRRAGRIGTTGASHGDRDTPLRHTTPEAPELYRLLARMVDDGVEIVALEVSSHALALDRVAGARFAVSAFLNLGHDHLDFHGSRRAYFEAKASMFESLDPGATAVLPADLDEGRELAGRIPTRVLRFGRGADADVRLLDEHTGLDGSSAVLDTPAGRLPVRSFLPGRYNLDNVAAAAACALALDLPPQSVTAGVLALERIPGRMERVECGQPFAVVVDYAHTPDALEQLLGAARRGGRGRVLVVFGAGGERDQGKRAPMGRVAATHADLLFVTSDNPRDEDPQAIADEIVRGATSVADGASRCRTIADRAGAIAAAVGEARAGDVVVVAGKGHETTQTAAGESRPFDDREQLRRALAAIGFDGARRADV